MQKQVIPIVFLAVIAAVLLTGQGVLASSTTNKFSITVNCNSGAQAHKQAESSTNNVNINVNCSSTGGTPGTPGTNGKNGLNGTNGTNGKNGVNATVTIVTTGNQTGNTTQGFTTKHFSCSSTAVMVPEHCVTK